MTTDPKIQKPRSAMRNKSMSVTRPAPAPKDSSATEQRAGTSTLTVAPALPPAFPPPKEPFARSRLRRRVLSR